MKRFFCHHLVLARLLCICASLFGLAGATMSTAQACSCFYPPGFGYSDYFDIASEALFGTVLFRLEIVNHYVYAVRPEVDLKGCATQALDTVWVRTAKTGAECGVELDPGERYLFHLGSRDSLNLYPVGLCGFYRKVNELSQEELEHSFMQSPGCKNQDLRRYSLE